MKLSYNWLCDYLPLKTSPDELSEILTSIGLEVESLEKKEAVKGNLEGLLIGEVLHVQPHPNADKLKLAKVNIGQSHPLSIVCGAPNVAAGQKVIVAPVGAIIHPVNGEMIQIKKAKIRGEESEGMICAEDEIGLGTDHNGIMILQNSAQPGKAAKEYFNLQEDWLLEIGLTPNRMDAMSHIGVARDVCAYFNHHQHKNYEVQLPSVNKFHPDNNSFPVKIKIENTAACLRYAGVSLTNITVAASPEWLQQRLKVIGVRPINNIVDITNFVLHECGQPLHAFNADAIAGREVIVKNLPQYTPFITLDEKERKLDADDLMICNTEEGMCIAGVFGGLHSGVTDSTKNIFLESACFQSSGIRRTSTRHNLRTDAAVRFEKGTDISNVLFALQRAALLIKEIAGGEIASDITDVYPSPKEKTTVILTYDYLQKLSGKIYAAGEVKHILQSLGFIILEENARELLLAVPYSKPDISLPADIVEEIMRIDGLDNIPVPSRITLSPAVNDRLSKKILREKIAAYLAGNGFWEIYTNSITNSRYFKSLPQDEIVKLINNLSADLDVLRPSMLETGLESIAYNLNRKNENLLFFEWGKIYSKKDNNYIEEEQLCLYLTGNKSSGGWMYKAEAVTIYYIKGLLQNILSLAGLQHYAIIAYQGDQLFSTQQIIINKNPVITYGSVMPAVLQSFDIRQEVWFAKINWNNLAMLSSQQNIQYHEIPRFPSVRRDLALILDKHVAFDAVEKTAQSIKSKWLQQVQLFDVFESEKLGADKKSYAVSFVFQDPEKTLTDKEIDAVMEKLMQVFTNNLQAEIRK